MPGLAVGAAPICLSSPLCRHGQVHPRPLPLHSGCGIPASGAPKWNKKKKSQNQNRWTWARMPGSLLCARRTLARVPLFESNEPCTAAQTGASAQTADWPAGMGRNERGHHGAMGDKTGAPQTDDASPGRVARLRRLPVDGHAARPHRLPVEVNMQALPARTGSLLDAHADKGGADGPDQPNHGARPHGEPAPIVFVADGRCR